MHDDTVGVEFAADAPCLLLYACRIPQRPVGDALLGPVEVDAYLDPWRADHKGTVLFRLTKMCVAEHSVRPGSEQVVDGVALESVEGGVRGEGAQADGVDVVVQVLRVFSWLLV